MDQHRPIIAVVDDDLPIVHLLDELLSDEGYTVHCIPASDRVASDVQQLAPNLLLLDVHLCPQHSGWDVLAALRADPATAALPVILCTADSRRPAHLAAANDSVLTWLVAKPFEIDSLLATIAEALTQGNVCSAVMERSATVS